MVTETGLPKSSLSWALTGLFITYGSGQLVSGYFGDRIQPKRLVAARLCTTIIVNLLIPLCSSGIQMTFLWCINGFAKAFMWPPIVKLMSTFLTETEYTKGCVRVSWGSSIATIFIYLVSAIMIMLAGWKSVFILCAAVGVAGLIMWVKLCP